MDPHVMKGLASQYDEEGVDKLVWELQKAQDEVKDWAIAKKWWDDGRTFGDNIALVHSELSEALEAFRDHDFERWVTDENGKRWLVMGHGVDEPSGGLVVYPDLMKPEGVASEIADTLIRMLHVCSHYGIDLGAEYRAKMAYNWTRTERHGGKRL